MKSDDTTKQSKSPEAGSVDVNRRTVLLGTTVLTTAAVAGVMPTTPVNAADTLPPADAKFQGQIGTYYTDSKAEIPALPSAPDGAPNILLVLLDDVGFGHTSTFGGPVEYSRSAKTGRRGASLQSIPYHGAVFADPRCAPVRAAITIQCTPASSWNWQRAFRVTTADGRRRPPASPIL